jgi:hypothetical protein
VEGRSEGGDSLQFLPALTGGFVLLCAQQCEQERSVVCRVSMESVERETYNR